MPATYTWEQLCIAFLQRSYLRTIPLGREGTCQSIWIAVEFNDVKTGEATPRGNASAVVPRVLSLRAHRNTVQASTLGKQGMQSLTITTVEQYSKPGTMEQYNETGQRNSTLKQEWWNSTGTVEQYSKTGTVEKIQ